MNSIFGEKEVIGEFQIHLPQLSKQPIKFYEFTRMKFETFNYILKKGSSIHEKIQTFLKTHKSRGKTLSNFF